MKRKKKKKKREKTTELLWKLSKRTLVSEQQLYLRPPSQNPVFYRLLYYYISSLFSHSRKRPAPVTMYQKKRETTEIQRKLSYTRRLSDTRKRTTALLTATFTKPRFFSTPIQTLYFQIPVSGMLQYSMSRGSPLSRASNVNHL